jgi:hypothetical protein
MKTRHEMMRRQGLSRRGFLQYQTLMNAALREGMRGFDIAETLRQVIREELHPT